MTTAVLLVFLGALSRLIPHPPNFVAMGALALYAGARLPRAVGDRGAAAGPGLSDFVLDAGTGRAVISGMRLTVYATFAVIVVAGRLPAHFVGAGPARRVLRRRVGALLPHVEHRGVARGSALSEDRRRTRALLRGGHSVLLEHARRGPARHGDALRPRRALAARALAHGRRGGRGGGALPARARAGARAAGPADVRERRRHRDVRARGGEGGRLRDHGHHAAGAREARVGGRVRRAARRSGPRRHAVRPAGLADVALHARHQLDADARPRGRRADELALLFRVRLVEHDDREHRAHRDRARPLLGALRLGRDRRCRAGVHAPAVPRASWGGRRARPATRERGRGPRTSPPGRARSRPRRAIATSPSTATARTRTGASATARRPSRRAWATRAASASSGD